MTYHGSNNGRETILVSRKGYSDLGNTAQAVQYCSQAYAGNPALAQACTQHYGSGRTDPFNPNAPVGAPGQQQPSGSSGVLATIGQVLSGGLNAYAAAKGAQGAYPYGMYPPPSNPMTMPLILGGIGIVAILLLRRPARSNPGRRRRRRRARHNGRRYHRRRRHRR